MARSARRAVGSIVLLTSVALTACKEQNTYVAPPPPTVGVSQPIKQTVTDYIEVSGNTQASNSVDLVARVEGYLKSVDFTDGTFVKKDDLLFVIEPKPYEAQVQLNKATIAQQQATLVQATAEYERQQRLIKQNATSQSELENWQAQRDAAQAAVQEANANLEIAQINLSYTKITAPFDGRMGRHQVDPGNLVGAGSPTELATIEQLAPIYVYFNVDERDVLRVRADLRARGQTVADLDPVTLGVGLQNETGYPHQATLDFIDAQVDQSTGTLQLRGSIANQDYEFLPGMFVRVRIPTGTTEDSLLVPDRALGVDQQGHYLLLVNKDDEVEQRTVKIGALVGTMRVITEGLKADDQVVVQGLQRAIPSDKVAPKEVTLTPPPAPAEDSSATAADTAASSSTDSTAPAAPATSDADSAADSTSSDGAGDASAN
ncbi:MAG: efflux RND transporter periplasmic adaptor subunit [Pseudomonadota bacterium]